MAKTTALTFKCQDLGSQRKLSNAKILIPHYNISELKDHRAKR
jgi:hypothetical protein